MNKEILFKHNPIPIFGRIIQLFCLLLIVRVSFLYLLNPLLSVLIILFLTFVFFLVGERSIMVTEDQIVIRYFHLLGIYDKKSVIELSDIEFVDYDKPGTFYLALILGGAASAQKSGRLIFKYKDGRYDQMVLSMPRSKQKVMFELLFELIEDNNK
ncbi:MAG: hypothetical protein K0B37_13225 [Bacteroidales bacterium]|nr:hypothetical protein [Bacteroidales bacterium]